MDHKKEQSGFDVKVEGASFEQNQETLKVRNKKTKTRDYQNQDAYYQNTQDNIEKNKRPSIIDFFGEITNLVWHSIYY